MCYYTHTEDVSFMHFILFIFENIKCFYYEDFYLFVFFLFEIGFLFVPLAV